MTFTLVRKFLRDYRVGLTIVALLLFLFQLLWGRVTQRIVHEILPSLGQFVPPQQILDTVFAGPGKIIQALVGGETIQFTEAPHALSVSYIHPVTQIILCVWAVGRAAGAIAGEIDRGTMELLMAQPIRRGQVLRAHLIVELITLPILCLSMWAGTWTGAAWVGFLDAEVPSHRVDPWLFAPGLLAVAALVFAVSGMTMALSAGGRFRGRVLGLAVVVTLLQFLINVIAQLWEPMEVMRPFTLFYYYQPQKIMLHADWHSDMTVWRSLAVLFAVGAAGYVLAWAIFRRRDLPAPL